MKHDVNKSLCVETIIIIPVSRFQITELPGGFEPPPLDSNSRVEAVTPLNFKIYVKERPTALYNLGIMVSKIPPWLERIILDNRLLLGLKELNTGLKDPTFGWLQ